MTSRSRWTVRRGRHSGRWFAVQDVSMWREPGEFFWFDSWREAYDFAERGGRDA